MDETYWSHNRSLTMIKTSFISSSRLFLPLLSLTWLSLLTACSANPKLEEVPEKGNYPDIPKILISGGDRIATQQEYKKILQSHTPDKNQQSTLNHLLLVTQSYNNSLLSTGNDAKLLVDGPATFKAMFKDIDNAKTSIDLETYILEDSEIGQKLASKLIAARKRGVHIRVLFDAVGSLELSEDYVERLEKADIDIHKFHPIDPTEDARIWRSNNRDHRKLLIVDGKIAYTGGINISSVYSKSSFLASRGSPKKDAKKDQAWRDTQVRITGPAVKQFQHHFVKMWNIDLDDDKKESATAYAPMTQQGNMLVGIIASEGGNDNESDVYSTLAATITHAQKRVWITQAYFAPDETMLDLIKATAKRGVDVRLLLPRLSDAPIIIMASRSSYKDLLKAGVRIYERTVSTLHAKTLVADGLWSSIGSTNFDYRSFIHNYELNALIISRDFGKEMEALFHKDLEQAHEIKLETWKDRPFIEKVKETLGGWLKEFL